jgi:hypothetical protein
MGKGLPWFATPFPGLVAVQGQAADEEDEDHPDECGDAKLWLLP